ncbi:hypothetical protein HDV03_004787 [Kappamyces sp. JEL0829]|nr:hypothetical protein HDV03_004787 [Kappamyces sp. JEL0829]
MKHSWKEKWSRFWTKFKLSKTAATDQLEVTEPTVDSENIVFKLSVEPHETPRTIELGPISAASLGSGFDTSDYASFRGSVLDTEEEPPVQDIYDLEYAAPVGPKSISPQHLDLPILLESSDESSNNRSINSTDLNRQRSRKKHKRSLIQLVDRHREVSLKKSTSKSSLTGSRSQTLVDLTPPPIVTRGSLLDSVDSSPFLAPHRNPSHASLDRKIHRRGKHNHLAASLAASTDVDLSDGPATFSSRRSISSHTDASSLKRRSSLASRPDSLADSLTRQDSLARKSSMRSNPRPSSFLYLKHGASQTSLSRSKSVRWHGSDDGETQPNLEHNTSKKSTGRRSRRSWQTTDADEDIPLGTLLRLQKQKDDDECIPIGLLSYNNSIY